MTEKINNANLETIITGAMGMLASAAAYTFIRKDVLRKTYILSGGIVRTGCTVLAAVVGVMAGTEVRKKANRIWKNLKKAFLEG